MPRNTALRFKSGKGKSVRSDKIRAQKKKEIKKRFSNFKSICLTLSFFLVSLLFMIGFFSYRRLNSAFVSADSYNSIDYSSMSYIVVDSFTSDPIHLEKINFLFIDKNSQKVSIYEMPLDMEVDLPGKYSEMPLEKTFILGGLNSEDKIKGGVDLINTTLFKIFGFDVTNYILVEKDLEGEFDNLFYEGKQVFPFGSVGFSKLDSSSNTSLSFKEFYQLQKFLNTLPSDNFSVTKFSASLLESSDLLDVSFKDLSLSSTIAEEKKTVSVLNGTNVPGVASFVSRVIGNIGGRLVAIENAQNSYNESILIVDDPNSATVSYIKNVFKVNTVYTKEDSHSITENEVSRSDITLIIGFDLSNVLY